MAKVIFGLEGSLTETSIVRKIGFLYLVIYNPSTQLALVQHTHILYIIYIIL